MKIDLKEYDVFEDESIEFSKKCNFIFGKNGTGKTTLTNLIKEQCADYEVKVFQGFETILGDNKKLNAVVLGEENLQISEKIKNIEELIEKKQEEKKIILQKIEEPKDNEENLWTKYKNAETEFNKKDKEIKDFFKKAAASIKNKQNPQIAITSYNINNLKDEISSAKLLTESEKNQCEEVCKSDVKLAKMITFPEIDLEKILTAVNAILEKKVEEKIVIARISSNEKRDFAKMGYNIHKSGEKCAFCGNVVEENTMQELKKYFSVDEVVSFKNEIEEKISNIAQVIQNIGLVEIDEEDFYPAYKQKIMQIKNDINEIYAEQRKYMQVFIDALKNKKGNIFSESQPIVVDISRKFDVQNEEYRKLVEENNNSKLEFEQKEAKNKLRYHYIQELLNDFEYKVRISERELLEKIYDNAKMELNVERDKIEGIGGIEQHIDNLKNEISQLQRETKGGKKLAENINKRLKNKVSFELEYCKQEPNIGYYHVKCLRTSKRRDITELSTGEKNIIAFLYFLEKLDEVVEEVKEEKGRIIVFDDPMTSNDDNMQYLIIDELQELIKNIKDPDKFILLTHNNHFYLNIEVPKKYKDNSYVHLLSNGKTTKIKVIKNENEDFKTSYAALWEEVRFLYDSDASAGMLLNPIRRIVETYTKFNVLNKNQFCKNQKGALKLFHVNSHSIDDLEADLNGKSKDEIIQLLQDCFTDNKADEHFKRYWLQTKHVE